MNRSSGMHRVELDALQARFALRLASRLSENADRVPHDIAERLRVAREQAVQRARQLRLAAPATAASMQVSQGSITLGQPTSWWLRLASVSPLVLLVLGLVFIQHLHDQADIHAAAEVDAALLADDLPPEAYGDPGFVVFLKQPEP
jgi:Protein of unknown function (DUF3619)